MKIDIEIIPHDCQRYPTVGDWQFSGPELIINVSETGNEDYNFLIALHEMIEAYLCKKHGVTEQQVDEWDKSHLESNDPGMLPNCPYGLEHAMATGVELAVGEALGIDFEDYTRKVDSLDNNVAL
jgi:hypothetical protein